jgi:hypothetical protein
MTPWPFAHLKLFGYDVIMIDPPWPWQAYSVKGMEKSRRRNTKR